MNRRIFTVLGLWVASMAAFAQFPQYKNTSLEDIDKGWANKSISNVANGSFSTMLESFNQTWPTWMMGFVCDAMKQGVTKKILDKETDLTVFVDTKNGFASVGDGGTDGEYMSACYWNRSNGHKLLAVCLGKPTDPCLEIVCFYDYDAAKKQLTPEPDILKGYRWHDRKEFCQIFCQLPRKGKDIVVQDWHADDGPVRHIFTWNGMKPVYSKSESMAQDEEPDYSVEVDYKGAAPNVKDFVEAMLARPDMGEFFGGMRDSWELYRNGMKQIPGDVVIVDVQNGYMGYVSEDYNERHVIELCYWNYADKKRKLVAMTNNMFAGDRAVNTEYTGIDFYEFNPETRKMTPVDLFEIGLDNTPADGVTAITHTLPCVGRSIVFTYHTKTGKIEKKYTWNGTKFIAE